MTQGQADVSEAGGFRRPSRPGVELDRLVEGELAAVLAEGETVAPPPMQRPADPAERFVERAAAFLAGRKDREDLLARLRAALPPEKPPPEGEGQQDAKPE